jgi:hypothetical protein
VSKRRLWIAGAVVLIAVLAHWAYWYRPREREGEPTGRTVAGRLYLTGELPYRVWLPYPHQNLGRLETAIGDVERFARAVAEISGGDLPELPAFGSARVPPSSELALAADRSGERFLVVAEVYPVAGILARLAGKLAGNPLLAGGAAEIGGRSVEVSWVDGAWIVSSRDLELPRDEVAGGPGEALTWARLDQPRGELPPGEYGLRRTDDALEITSGGQDALRGLGHLDGVRSPVPLLMAEVRPSADGVEGRSLALLPGFESVAALPGAVAVHRGGDRWRLPGERILELVGNGPPSAPVAGWTAVSLDRRSLGQAPSIVGFLDGLHGAPAALGVWIDPRAARQLAEQTARALEAVPIVGEREAARWWALTVVLEPFSRGGWLTATVAQNPPAVRLRLASTRESLTSGAAD